MHASGLNPHRPGRGRILGHPPASRAERGDVSNRCRPSVTTSRDPRRQQTRGLNPDAENVKLRRRCFRRSVINWRQSPRTRNTQKQREAKVREYAQGIGPS